MSQVYAVVPETCDQVLQVCEGVDLFRDGILIIYLSLNLLIGWSKPWCKKERMYKRFILYCDVEWNY